MKAMVLAAGLGTRLKPITFEIPKPMVPVLDRPVMAHIVGLLERQGFDELIANLHYYPDTIRDYFGDRLEYRFEEELLGTAGGVRNVRGLLRRRPGRDRLRRRPDRHRPARPASSATGQRWGIATLTVKKVRGHARVRGGHARLRRPHPGLPGEARAGRGAVGPRQLRHLLLLARRSSTTSRSATFADWAQDVFPALLENDVPVPHARDRRLLERRRLARGAARRAPSTRWRASCASSVSPGEPPDGRRGDRRARSGWGRRASSARACA